MAAYVELLEWINAETVEHAYRRARRAQREGNQRFADQGWRVALKGDAKMLKVLELATEILRKMSEQQLGIHGLDVEGTYAEATEYNLWREAYKSMDAGKPMRNFEWIYGAAAWLAGYND